tara:strand:+ start:4906 stop:5325 length:420 start_codon:yes stop_codon:yes gene_type:complete
MKKENKKCTTCKPARKKRRTKAQIEADKKVKEELGKIDTSELNDLVEALKTIETVHIKQYSTIKPLTKTFYDKLVEFFKDGQVTRIKHSDQVNIINIFNTTFSQRRSLSQCIPCVRPVIDSLFELYNIYKTNVVLDKIK